MRCQQADEAPLDTSLRRAAHSLCARSRECASTGEARCKKYESTNDQDYEFDVDEDSVVYP
eukprot:scaffold16140_cov28-Tisochrysis_lutea.AAC.4